jgi:SAM-dependent methyltransferase
MSVERLVRRVVPSLARLTFNPVFKLTVDMLDLVPRLMFPELATLPPNHLRIRIGVDNRIFTNGFSFFVWPTAFWTHFLRTGLCRIDSTIVDIGCGCGRYARFLRDYQYKSERFTGRYIGVDVDPEMLAWCSRHFDSERFEFHRSSHSSRAYRAEGSPSPAPYELPMADGTADFVFSTSLFSHLLEGEVVNYCRESYRVLRAGGHMVMYFFSLDRPPPTYGGRHTFGFQVGHAHVESLSVPEAAVAYREEYLISVARDAGFRTADIQAAPGDAQPILICSK